MSLPPAPSTVSDPAAVEHIGTVIAVDFVVEAVAEAVDCARAVEQGQLFDAHADRVVDARENPVEAGKVGIDRLIADIVDPVLVAPPSAAHDVGADAAVEDVRVEVAPDLVVETVAGGVDRIGVVDKVKTLHMVAERVAEPGADLIGALVGILDDHVAGIWTVVLIIADFPPIMVSAPYHRQ